MDLIKRSVPDLLGFTKFQTIFNQGSLISGEREGAGGKAASRSVFPAGVEKAGAD
jgi:hypothetical protein